LRGEGFGLVLGEAAAGGPAIMSLPIVMGAAVTGVDCTSPLMTKAVEASTASFQLLWLAG
jgi:hypothetical protein